MTIQPSIDYLRDTFYIDDGFLFRKSNNKICGFYDKSCLYYRMKIKNKSYLLHRIIFAITHGYFPKFVDHINRNRLDNRIENLRPTEKKQNNTINSEARSDNTSGFKGVTWHKTSKKWHSSVFKDGKRYYLGVYEDINKAAEAYNKKVLELFGEFAVLNEMKNA